MTLTIDAIYEHGVFRPLESLTLSEHQPVRLQIDVPAPAAAKPSVRDILRDAGHLAELGPYCRSLINPDVTLEEVIEALDKAGGQPLSEIIIEQRGPR